jgi:hypothetical protein
MAVSKWHGSNPQISESSLRRFSPADPVCYTLPPMYCVPDDWRYSDVTAAQLHRFAAACSYGACSGAPTGTFFPGRRQTKPESD